MKFGLHNALGPFQQLMDVVLPPVKWQFAIMYLHDIIVFSRNEDEHASHVRAVMSLLHNIRVTLNFKKCNFYTRKVYSLGYITWPGRLELADYTTNTTRDLRPPHSVNDLKLFLGL